MKLGLIARADNRGLGIQTWEFYQHMKPAKTLVIDVPSVQPLAVRNRFPDAVTISGWPEPGNYARFLDGLDAVYTAETPYHHSLFSIGAQLGVRSVLAVNPEFLDQMDHPELPAPSVYACPSSWMFDKIPQPKTMLPFPVATERFSANTATKATNFLHVVGRPAIHDRNGTESVLTGLQYVQSEITLTICCQQQGHVEQLIRHVVVPDNVKVQIQSRDVADYWINYQDQHVLILPRRFGGLCLPMQEALAAGMPVVMPNVPPNSDRLPDEWLTTSTQRAEFVCRGNQIAIYDTHSKDLAQLIDRFASDRDFYVEQKEIASGLAKAWSWDNLKPRYDEVFEG